MRKKILIVGNSANAYALAKKLSEEHDIFITPGSDTLKEFAACLDIRENNISELLDFVMENDINLTIAVSQIAIREDIATKFANNKLAVFAPSAKSNELIADKILAKKTLYKLRIPTPKFGIFEKNSVAIDYLKNQSVPFVLKNNDSNSATIITSLQTAKKLIENSFVEKNNRIIIEDYIYGTPFSYYAVTDGYKALPLGSSILYKHSLEGDGGQLTSGMGACVPNYKLSVDDEYFIMDNVIYPTLEFLENNGSPYLGIMGINGIIQTDGSLQILGWQSFTQDCDTDGILNSVENNLYELFESCVIGSFSDEYETLEINGKASVSLVLTSKNNDNNQNIIHGLDNIAEETKLSFFPYVTKNRYLEYEASKGNNIVLTSSASSIAKASEKVYEEVKCIDFAGINYRNDICNLYNKV